jgi:Fic family protein
MKKLSGRLIRSREGYQFYVPNPLPPKIEWGTSTLNALSSATTLLGQLAGEGRNFPNPHIFVRPFITNEAVLSSRIEGTQATLEDVLAAQAGATVQTDVADLKEVNNYIIALDYGIKRLKTLPLSLRLIREIHEKLMTKVRGGHATPGEFRKSQNWIGVAGCTLTTATYIPPSLDYLMDCLGDFEKFLYNKTLPPLIQIALAHYQFEAIHPFLDGNGRVGRLLITLFLTERGILPSPLLYPSAFFQATRREYYDRLLAVTQHGEWETWLQYFLNGIAYQAEDVLMRTSNIKKLLTTWREQTERLATPIPRKLIDQLTANPFITISYMATKMKVSYTTVQRALHKLEELKIVQEVSGGKRNRMYCAKDLLEILEKPLHVKMHH